MNSKTKPLAFKINYQNLDGYARESKHLPMWNVYMMHVLFCLLAFNLFTEGPCFFLN